MPTFGDLFRAILEKRGLTQDAAAARLGTRQSVISYYCSLERPPRRGTLLNIADGLSIDIEELSGETRGKKADGKMTTRPCAKGEEFPFDALADLRRRWKKPQERDAIRHLLAMLFPGKSDKIVAWLEQRT